MIRSALTKIFRRSLPLLFLLTISSSSHSQNINASVQLDSSEYRIGDPIGIVLDVDHPYGVAIDWMENTPVPENFVKLSESSVDSIQQNSFLTEKKVITVSTFDTGRIIIPEFKIWYHDKSGTLNSVTTAPVAINVSLIQVNLNNSFHPIAPPLQLPPSNILLYLSIAGILLVVAAFFLYQLWKRKKGRQSSITNKNLPKESVLIRLQNLKKEIAQRKISIEPFYVSLTNLLREHIEERFAYPAFEHTSPEIIRFMKQQLNDTELLQKVSGNLEIADLVKFAKVKPDADENHAVMESALDFVRKTGNETHQTSNDAI